MPVLLQFNHSVYQDIMVTELNVNRSPCVVFVRVYVKLCTVMVIELIVFSHNKAIIDAIAITKF